MILSNIIMIKLITIEIIMKMIMMLLMMVMLVMTMTFIFIWFRECMTISLKDNNVYGYEWNKMYETWENVWIKQKNINLNWNHKILQFYEQTEIEIKEQKC